MADDFAAFPEVDECLKRVAAGQETLLRLDRIKEQIEHIKSTTPPGSSQVAALDAVSEEANIIKSVVQERVLQPSQAFLTSIGLSVSLEVTHTD